MNYGEKSLGRLIDVQPVTMNKIAKKGEKYRRAAGMMESVGWWIGWPCSLLAHYTKSNVNMYILHTGAK